MPPTTQIKEEFYIRCIFNDDVPLFADATRYIRQEMPYPLSTKRSLKGTCGVRTDDEVVAFSLRSYSGKQAEREVENVESTVDGKSAAQNLLRLRMPRRTLHLLNERARELSTVLGDDVIVEIDEELYVLTLDRTGSDAELELVGKLTKSADMGYVRSEITEADTAFELPISGVRLRVFFRSPVRDRILAYGYGGYLTRKPGEMETVIRATALTLNSLLGLATFRLLSSLDHIEVPPLPSDIAILPRKPSERATFDVPVLLFTGDGVPAARGHIAAEIDLDQVNPVSGSLQFLVSQGDRLEWNAAVADSVRFAAYERVLTETIASVVYSVLGDETVRDIAYDIMLGELEPETVTSLRNATAGFPSLAATPTDAEVREVRLAEPSSGTPAA